MTPRQLRRSLERKERKIARKAANNPAASTVASSHPPPPQVPPEPPAHPPTTSTDPEIIALTRVLDSMADASAATANTPYIITPARQAASRENGRNSHGALTPETKAISAQNHTTHGLARHQERNFKLLLTEDPALFEALKKGLLDEHQPATETESILVNHMIESEWLARRAQRLQDTCLSPETGQITDEKKFSLYVRYQTTHTRAFHKCVNDLAKFRKERRQADLGVEAQNRENERHIWQKLRNNMVLFRKDVNTQLDLTKLVTQLLEAEREIPVFPKNSTPSSKKEVSTRNGGPPRSHFCNPGAVPPSPTCVRSLSPQFFDNRIFRPVRCPG